ncbi:type III secretion system export apparatus subunit SctT [Roseateles sp. SL47]|uniref:type III secretion system export apparatus subunit SctT n=1 Tax=Roseateles sp. SL47 TaxID=2995138 RepID=UPI00226EA746|nr:type III secretion system export apparatus subunit SctT [Roseateles sp. SL47]WAC74582.1 type III secretion system export apparatus subunit SctT [Roseateles sp. SL47]
MTDITQTGLVEFANAALRAAVLGVPRLFVCMALLPLFPSSVFPRLLKVGVAMGLGAPVCLGVYWQMQEAQAVNIGALVAKECVLGLLLGLMLAAPLWAIEAVGTLTDNQRGANAAQQVTPFAQADASVIGSALLQAMVVVLAASGAFALVYRFLLFSFEAWPVLQPLPDLTVFSLDHSLRRFGEFVMKAVLFAAPMLTIVLLIDFVFALMGVFAPQLQTYFAAFPMKSLCAILVLALYLTVLLGHGERYLLQTLDQETRLLEQQSGQQE